MTTYFTITEAMTDPDRFIPAELAKAWWKNPIAIGEADSTVPLNLLPTVFLGSANTPIGTSVSVTGLNLAPYKTLKVFANISASGGSGSTTLVMNGAGIAASTLSTPVWVGMIEVDLFGGIAGSTLSAPAGGASTLTNASTSVTISISGASFSGGSFRIYGCK